jgi:hypothetical protein
VQGCWHGRLSLVGGRESRLCFVLVCQAAHADNSSLRLRHCCVGCTVYYPLLCQGLVLACVVAHKNLGRSQQHVVLGPRTWASSCRAAGFCVKGPDHSWACPKLVS